MTKQSNKHFIRVTYKQTLNPLYTFEKKDIRTHDIAIGAKIVLEDGYLYEVDESHDKKYIICDIRNLIEITQ